jgi:hypothetical protein
MIDPHYKPPEDYRWATHPLAGPDEESKDKGTGALVVIVVVAAIWLAQWMYQRQEAESRTAARRRRALQG